jgi:hypothetical protein
MAFLDNSGDIILDAVLTDTGRMRLAKGDGSFKIVKFALGDDEINYGLYDKTNTGGSAFYDLEIMQTPVLEAFTNNASSMKSKLISISRNNLLYLPVIKVNNISRGASNFAVQSMVVNGYILAVDRDTERFFTENASLTYNGSLISANGILNGFSTTTGLEIRTDQGIDNSAIPPSTVLDPDLKETQYLVEIDNRFGSVVDPNGNVVATPSYIDDDNIATYYFSQGVDISYVSDIETVVDNTISNNVAQVLAGARGTKLMFKIKSSIDVSTTSYLFTELGTNITSNFGGATGYSDVRSILTSVRVTGVTTGNYVDIPLLLVKKIS